MRQNCTWLTTALWRASLDYTDAYDLIPKCREELFYQLGLRQFGNFGHFRLDPPAPLHRLISLAVENEDGIEKCGLQKVQVIDVRFNREGYAKKHAKNGIRQYSVLSRHGVICFPSISP